MLRLAARSLFFFNDTATTEIYTLSLHDALPICTCLPWRPSGPPRTAPGARFLRSEEHTSELQSRLHLVCRLLLEKKTTRHERRSRTLCAGTVARGALAPAWA